MKRVLFADNDPDFLNTRAESLEAAGYRVFKAQSLAEAKSYLQETWSPVVVLDLRLTDDDDEKDLSGLGLAKMGICRAVAKIVLTAFPTPEVVRELLKLQREGRLAVDVLAKEEGPDAMIRAVEQAFIHHVRINWELSTRWNTTNPLSFPHLVNLIEPDLPSERLIDRADELEDLFRHLLYERSQVTIDRLLWQRKERIALTVFAFAPDKPSESCVVICGPPDRVLDEWQRYKKFAPAGAGARNATLATANDYAETTHFAAFTLTGVPVDRSFRTLEEFYYSNPDRRDVQVVLESVGATLAAWHHGQRIPAEPPTAESELYRARLGLTQISAGGLDEGLSALRREAAANELTLNFTAETCQLLLANGQVVAFPNLRALLFHKDSEDALTALCSIAPGTLTPQNVLIASSDNLAWLTEFSEAGPAPAYWNFTALEAALRFDLTTCNDLTQLYEMERRLTEPSALGHLDVQTHMDKSVRPTLQWIELVRRKAAEVAGYDVQAYHRGLFFHATSRVVAFELGIHLTRGQVVRVLHALLAAGLTYERTLQAQQIGVDNEAVLRIDQANAKVWVGQRSVHLPPTEFDLLAYLYSRAGQLCSHDEIIMQVWKPKGNPETLRSTLHTTVGRLRSKVEPDPARPRYIVREQARGYRLVTQPEK